MDIIASRLFMCPSDIMPADEKRSLNDKFMLRLPEGMRESIRIAAEANRRSMNAEIIARLEYTFFPLSGLASDDIEDPKEREMMNEIRKMMVSFAEHHLERRTKEKHNTSE